MASYVLFCEGDCCESIVELYLTILEAAGTFDMAEEEAYSEILDSFGVR